MVRDTFHGCIFICGWCFLNYLEASDVENSTQQFNERRNHTYHSLYLRSIRVVCYIRVDTYMLMKCALKCEKRGKKMNKMEKKRKSNALQNDQIANILWKNYDSHIFRMIATSSYIKIRICSIWYVFYDNEIEIRREKKTFEAEKICEAYRVYYACIIDHAWCVFFRLIFSLLLLQTMKKKKHTTANAAILPSVLWI